MGIKIFRKCGVTFVLFPLILALLFMTGCIEEKVHLLYASPSEGASLQESELPWSGQARMEMDPELESDLFSVQVDVILTGNGTLPYILFNATLHQGKGSTLSTRYLLMQLEPDREYSFEMAKSVRLSPGSYTCTLEASGPGGIIARESRKCTLEESELLPSSASLAGFISQTGADGNIARQRLTGYVSPEESRYEREVSGRAVEEAKEAEEINEQTQKITEENKKIKSSSQDLLAGEILLKDKNPEDKDSEETDPEGTDPDDLGEKKTRLAAEPEAETVENNLPEDDSEQLIEGSKSNQLIEGINTDGDLDPEYNEREDADSSDGYASGDDPGEDADSSDGYASGDDPGDDRSALGSIEDMAESDGGAAGINNGSVLAVAVLEDSGAFEDSGEEFVGSSTSKKYHLPECRYVLKIKDENKIRFQDHEDAKRQGYLPCKSCHP